MLTLKKQIIELFELVNGQFPSPQIQNQIQEKIEENDLDDNTNVPKWFTELLQCIISNQTKERTFYKYEASEGDVSNFLAELEDLINAEWNDYGEALEITFPNQELFAIISTEGNFWEVKKIKGTQ